MSCRDIWGFPKIRGTLKGGYRECIGIERVIEGLGFPKIRGNILGVPIIRIAVFGGLYWVSLAWETTIYAANGPDSTPMAVSILGLMTVALQVVQLSV